MIFGRENSHPSRLWSYFSDVELYNRQNMTGINIKNKLSIIVAVIVISGITPCSPTISDRRLCYDPKCSVPVSEATTLIKYNSIDPDIMSFESNVKIIVFSKSAGKRLDLWGVEINGKRGYVPKSLIKEKRVINKLLIHEVPTEEIVTTNDTITKPNDVPKVADTVTKPINAQETLKTDGIVEKASSPLIPEPTQPMPSFEIHDGTTIHLAGNDEPPEPSYSTAIPKPIIDVGEQPILSIHPNIASSVTLKTHQAEFPIEDDAEKYLKTAGLRDNLSNKEIVAKESSDNPTEYVLLDLNYEKQTEGTDSVKIIEISKEKKITEDNAVETSTKFSVSLSQEEKSETKRIDEGAFTTKSSDRPANIENNVAKKSAEQSDNLSNDMIENQVAEKEKTSEGTVEKSPPKEEIQSSPVQQLLSKEEIQNNPVEGTTESPTSQSLEKKDKIEKISTNDIQDDKRVVEDPKVSLKEIDKTKNVTEDVALVADAEKSSQLETEETKEHQAQNDLSNNGGEPENMNSTENSVPIEEKGDSIEKSDEMTTKEEVPSNINVMNPLFNRLSMLPSLVKEVVENAILSDSSATKSTSDEKIVEVETNILNDETVIDESSSNSNFPTSNSEKSNSPNDIDNSISAEVSESDTERPEGDESNQDKFVNNDINNSNIDSEKNKNESTADTIDVQKDGEFSNKEPEQPGIYKEDELSGFGRGNVAMDDTSSFNGFPANRNLLNVGSGLQPDEQKSAVDTPKVVETEMPTEFGDEKSDNEPITESSNEHVLEMLEVPASILRSDEDMVTEMADACLLDSCQRPEGIDENQNFVRENINVEEEIDIMDVISIGRNYWETLTYVVVTAFTTLLFSLGYYYIENTRRDGQFIAKINKLEKELLVCTKECTVLDDSLKSTKTKLDSIEDESFGSNEMVASLKTDLEASKIAKSELEDQVAMLEKELESATEAGLELERMLREILSTNNEDNPLAQSVEDLQTRLNAQQAANEALTNALNLKAQENETLTSELKAMTQKYEQMEVELARVTEELKHQSNAKSNLEHMLLEKVESLEKQMKDISAERINLRKQLKGKEMEMKDLLEVVNQMNINNLDFEKLYNVSQIKAEASQLLEERDELKIRLSEVEGAHQLLEEHAKLINEEVSSMSEQCKLAEKAKRDAETRVEVLSNFFKEKEAQRQKEEAVWLQKQGEVSSTVERLHTMQNEIHNYKQQIEMLKREILDQEREYKNQIASLETKSHEQWVIARQNERRLEESKVEAGQLRNRLTLIEKNLNDADPDAKLHRLEANGDTATSPQLFIGAEASSSPIMFTGSSGVPLPPPPSYLYGPPVPPFMPPPPHGSSGISSYEVGQRPPPLGGRLSSPPPLHGTNSGRYDNPRSPPPPLSPSMLPPYGHHPPHRAYPPPFPNDRIHPPPPPHSTILPPWADETLGSLRNSSFQPHQKQQQQQQPPHHRDHQRTRNHKGSLHSSGESLDKNL